MTEEHSTTDPDAQREPSCMDDYDPDSLTIEQAIELINSTITHRPDSEELPLLKATNRVLAQDILAPVDVPDFRNSAMDGYAFSSQHLTNQPLKVAGSSFAGHPPANRAPNDACVRVMTGALVPDYYDTVVMQENVIEEEDQITISVIPNAGDNVRERGSNVKQGTLILKRGQSLNAAAIGLIASLGLDRVSVAKKLRIGCFSTGDELVPPGETTGLGEIFDSNRFMLMALLSDPRIETVDLGIRKDSKQELHDCLNQTKTLDMVISSGGVSVGDADFVRQVISDFGRLNMWKVAMKPGRPLTHAIIHDETHYFGLPGNPVSSIVTFHQFVRPAINAMLGLSTTAPISVNARLSGNIGKRAGRVELQRGLLVKNEDGEWRVSSTGQQDSHVLSSMVQANCYIFLDIESVGATEGQMVETWPFLNF